jgi:hypothetical protein
LSLSSFFSSPLPSPIFFSFCLPSNASVPQDAPAFSDDLFLETMGQIRC